MLEVHRGRAREGGIPLLVGGSGGPPWKNFEFLVQFGGLW